MSDLLGAQVIDLLRLLNLDEMVELLDGVYDVYSLVIIVSIEVQLRRLDLAECHLISKIKEEVRLIPQLINLDFALHYLFELFQDFLE